MAAEKLGWLYLDTGAMYRAMAVKTLQQGIALDDADAIGDLARKVHMRMEQDSSGMRILVDGEDVTDQIRTPEIDKAVGPVCEVPAVREEMVRLQRHMRYFGHLVTDGRDMGTVVFPDADLKFFMTASIDARAKRRQIDMKKQGIRVSLKTLRQEIQKRDERDSTRSHSPLRQADDAILIDTSDIEVHEQLEIILQKTNDLLHRIPRHQRIFNWFYNFSVFLVHYLLRAFFGYQIIGRENVHMIGGLLVAPNHVSMMDPPIVGTSCPREMSFFAKQELFEVPLLASAISKLNAFPVRRETGDRGAIRAAFEALEQKRALLLFPEGTRSRSGKIQSAKTGIGMIAVRNGVDIVPVAVLGTYQAWRNIFHRRIRVIFGKPIAIAPFLNSPLPKKEVYRQVGELTIKRIKELQNDYHN